MLTTLVKILIPLPPPKTEQNQNHSPLKGTKDLWRKALARTGQTAYEVGKDSEDYRSLAA